LQVDSTGSKGASTQALGILDIVWGPSDAGHAWWKARNFRPPKIVDTTGMIVVGRLQWDVMA